MEETREDRSKTIAQTKKRRRWVWIVTSSYMVVVGVASTLATAQGIAEKRARQEGNLEMGEWRMERNRAELICTRTAKAGVLVGSHLYLRLQRLPVED